MSFQSGTFKAFAESYLIARAPTFEKGKELEEGWNAMLTARTLWRGLERMSTIVDEEMYGLAMTNGAARTVSRAQISAEVIKHMEAKAGVVGVLSPPAAKLPQQAQREHDSSKWTGFLPIT